MQNYAELLKLVYETITVAVAHIEGDKKELGMMTIGRLYQHLNSLVQIHNASVVAPQVNAEAPLSVEATKAE